MLNPPKSFVYKHFGCFNTLLFNGGIQLKTGGTAKLSLSGDDVDVVGTVTAAQFGTSSQNAYGARTVGTGTPTGGSNGDIYYKY